MELEKTIMIKKDILSFLEGESNLAESPEKSFRILENVGLFFSNGNGIYLLKARKVGHVNIRYVSEKEKISITEDVYSLSKNILY